MLELAKALVGHGHDVTVITGFPNHPEGRVFGGYTKRVMLREEVHGVQIQRVWLATSHRRTRLNRGFTFLSFTVSACLALLFMRSDMVFAVLQPLSIGPLLSVICRIKGAKLVFNVQDLHPDVPIELGFIRNPRMIRLLRSMECFSYRHCDAVTTICESFQNHVQAKRGGAEHVYVVPNWIDTEAIYPQSRKTAFRQELGLDDEHIVCLFAGTVGHVAGAEVVLDTAEGLRTDEHIRFLFVGEGPGVPLLKENAAKRGLSNVLFVGFQPRERLAEIQSTADISLVTLRRGKGVHSVPSKVLGYMAAGRPVVAAVDEDSETARQIRSAGCGVIVPAETPEMLLDAIVSLARDKAARDRLGQSGRSHLEKKLTMERVLEQYTRVLETVSTGGMSTCQRPASDTL